ncbi:hypothetical protein BT69DRAFT_1276987 [Atractiella rhizophila]|nr:hypothetical protein BT69DRAFT_1276987 [Atractiella rhizophila]
MSTAFNSASFGGGGVGGGGMASASAVGGYGGYSGVGGGYDSGMGMGMGTVRERRMSLGSTVEDPFAGGVPAGLPYPGSTAAPPSGATQAGYQHPQAMGMSVEYGGAGGMNPYGGMGDDYVPQTLRPGGGAYPVRLFPPLSLERPLPMSRPSSPARKTGGGTNLTLTLTLTLHPSV